jgi:chondroitin polymerizing factor
MLLPKICRIRSSQLSANQYFILSLVCGFLLSFYWPVKYIQDNECSPLSDSSSIRDNEYGQLNEDFEPQLNLEKKPMIAKKPVKSIVRPRYFSTELNVRLDRLFVGVLTVQENIDTLSTAFNKTSAHLVNKIKFFIHANNVKTNFKLKNIVGFTDTRENYRPFHVLKYIADNYVEDFDFFYLIEDSAYLNAKALMEQLSHISMSFDIYMGSKVEERDEGFCDLKAGIILSSSVIKKIQRKLDSCVRGADGTHHSVNIGRCIQLSTDLKECQESFQGIASSSFQLSNQKIYRDLHNLKDDPGFNNATSIFPVTTSDDIYILHAYFSRLNLEAVKLRIKNLEQEALSIGNGTISNNVLEVKWPLGVPSSVKPQHRHDMIIWTNLNLTHSFMGDDGSNVKPLSKVDSLDIQKILDGILAETAKKYPELIYTSLQSAYRKFDPVRGMDYRIHLKFRDSTGQTVLKSFEVVKPISLIQIIPSPYVTESTRISMVVPTFVHRIDETIDFIAKYEEICMQNKDSTTLMLVLLYNSDASNKGESDVFYSLKNHAIATSKRIKNDDSRIAWVSIRLPVELDYKYDESEEMLTSMYGKQEILSLAATDLALRKIGLESLVLLFSNVVNFKNDFLNRVRMNTIQGFQVYSPIGFTQYPCKFTGLCNVCESCDVSQSGGYFDRHNYDVISFYSRDYVEGEFV